jgi:hypothetical protein
VQQIEAYDYVCLQEEKPVAQTKVEVDLSRIEEKEFAPDRALRVATVKNGVIVDQKVIKPKESKSRKFSVELELGDPEDGVYGAEVVVDPAEDERNIFSKLTARKFVSGAADKINGGVLQVNPSVYGWWRFCWFPRTYRVTGRVVRTLDDCVHPIAGANVQIFDVDYCWWWFDENLLRTGTTDVNGFFDISFTWCVPLYCLFEIVKFPPIQIDPRLRDRIRAALEERVIVKFPPPPPPDPWTWERQLAGLGIDVPAAGRPQLNPAAFAEGSRIAAFSTDVSPRLAATRSARPLASQAVVSAAKLSAIDVFSPVIYWPPCDNPCDWLPDLKIRVTQNQFSGPIVIYQDSYWQVHFNQSTDLLNLTLEANANALYAADCNPNPILGNCMLLDAVGSTQIMPTAADPLSGIYQPDVTQDLPTA